MDKRPHIWCCAHKSRWSRHPLHALVLGAALLAASLLISPVARGAGVGSPTFVYAQAPCTGVYLHPTTSAPLLTQLIGGSELTLVGATQASDGTQWDHILFWSGLDGYVRAADVGATPPPRSEEGTCTFPGLADTEANPLSNSSGPWPLTAQAHSLAPVVLLSSPSGNAFPVAEIARGSAVSISAWAADASDLPWYRASLGNATGWLPAAFLRLDGDPATQRVNGAPIWQPIAGKGMWFVNYLPHHSDVGMMVQAAKLAGLTHLYAEVAVSTPESQGGDGLNPGFFGQGTLDRLLPAAHAANIKVIATVYVALDRVATDVRLSSEVAQYTTPSGDHVDGLAMDIEANTAETAVYDYGQVVRATLGPNMLMVANVFHPMSEPYYPFDAIAASWNVISPMDYWHSDLSHIYSATDTSAFVAISLTMLRAAVGPNLAIEELGQMYDIAKDRNGEDGTGGSNAPGAGEIVADMRTARRLGCIGVTYFQWQDATQNEWHALATTPW